MRRRRTSAARPHDSSRAHARPLCSQPTSPGRSARAGAWGGCGPRLFSLRGQPSPKFDAGQASCKVAAATDSDGWVASRLRAARACHLGTSVRACALGWRQSPRQLSGCSGRARYRPAEQRDALPHPWAMYQQLGKVPRGRTRHPARRPRHVIGDGKAQLGGVGSRRRPALDARGSTSAYTSTTWPSCIHTMMSTPSTALSSLPSSQGGKWKTRASLQISSASNSPAATSSSSASKPSTSRS